MNNLYFDHNATTPVSSQVFQALQENWQHLQYNPSSSHQMGQKARQLLIQAARDCEELLSAGRDELVYTSGATEAINMALCGAYFGPKNCDSQGKILKNKFIASPDNHPAVRQTLAYLEQKHGAKITWLTLQRDGSFAWEELEQALDSSTLMVCLLAVNNETGYRLPWEMFLSRLYRLNILVHLDATQVIGRVPGFLLRPSAANFISFSGHKMGALKGCGALYIRDEYPLEPLIHGGKQQISRRGGTENLPGIFSMAVALRDFAQHGEARYQKILDLRQYLEKNLSAEIGDTWINGHATQRVAGTLNMGFAGIEAQSLLMSLDLQGVCVSYGSACSSGSLKPSPILLAMGLSEKEALASIRISLWHTHELADCDKLIEAIKTSVTRLRNL